MPADQENPAPAGDWPAPLLWTSNLSLSQAAVVAHDVDGNSSTTPPWFGSIDSSAQSMSSNEPSLPTNLIENVMPGHGVPLAHGRRFSKESLHILRTWLSENISHPYLNDTERVMLQYRTGLTKTQVLNWLANARRRNASKNPTTSRAENVNSESPASSQVPIRCPTPRPAFGTPDLNPLQRWMDSPPESEAARIHDIARAVGLEPTATGTCESGDETDDCKSETSSHGLKLNTLFGQSSWAGSAATSEHSGSSAQSMCSSGPSESFQLLRNNRKKRNKLKARKPSKFTRLLPPKTDTFQCTFCTATFSKKHDWNRHEKTQHIALESWVCSRFGSCFLDSEDKISCVFCGTPEPDASHLRIHNHLACQGEASEQALFSRKDHLRQHLRLVHGADFFEPSMKQWRFSIDKVRSRCGFCSLQMETWEDRVNHLADHFKRGHTMAAWEGDWGFDTSVLHMVEKALPPYLIDMERNSPFPLRPNDLVETPQNAYDVIKLELVYSIENTWDTTGEMPLDDEIQLEACRIIFASETPSAQSISPSWLRDLLMSKRPIALKAKFGPLRTEIESRFSTLKIHGKKTLFESCTLEGQLRSFMATQALVAGTVEDSDLQREACAIIERIEKASDVPSNFFARWLSRLVWSSTDWLIHFRERAATMVPWDLSEIDMLHLLDDEFANMSPKPAVSSEEITGASAEVLEYDFSLANDWQEINSYTGILGEVYNYDQSPIVVSPMNGTPAESNLTQDSGLAEGSHEALTNSTLQSHNNYDFDETGRPRLLQKHFFFTNDPNFPRWLHRELSRWVAATMSINNPTQHTPSDEEIQHQARWILHDNGDPWNQTPADNIEWLKQFKISVGLIQ